MMTTLGVTLIILGLLCGAYELGRYDERRLQRRIDQWVRKPHKPCPITPAEVERAIGAAQAVGVAWNDLERLHGSEGPDLPGRLGAEVDGMMGIERSWSAPSITDANVKQQTADNAARSQRIERGRVA